MMQESALVALGIVILYFGAEWLVRGSARIAASLGVPPIVVGLTVVSIGTSAPELAVCLLAALRGTPDIAMGNVMGSNLANIGLILGLTAIIRPLDVAARVVSREVPVMVVITAGLFFLIWDGHLGRGDGGILLVVLAAYLIFVFRSAATEGPAVVGEFERFAEASTHVVPGVRMRDIGLVILGSGCLVLAGRAIVDSAEYVAAAVGIPPLLISLSVIAIGTSLPELATSLVAATRGEADIAVGNVIGSNVLNIAAILGITGLVRPLDVASSVVRAELPAVLLLSLVVFPVSWSAFRVQRWEGGLLLALYLGLMAWLFQAGAF
ncbi:MAG TPA: calcium/sodium antiporter [Longimicrobiales bacterium]|nr:calcium/sodium antiporter [Longimicrobiales bacterium]